MQPTILCPWDYKGLHGARKEEAENRFFDHQWQDLSTVIVTPTRTHQVGPSPKWISALGYLMKPMNQKVAGPLFVTGMEVGRAYCEGLKAVFQHDDCKNFKYMLTLEDDVIPEPDALLETLAVATETGADVTAAVYWVKGENGWPHIYGDVNDTADPYNQRVIMPDDKRWREVNGVAMGFTLFRLDLFAKYFPELDDNWFVTDQVYDREEGRITRSTQDLTFCHNLRKRGGKIVVAQWARCGHYQADKDILW